jgi:hypothetical protein
VKIAKKFKKNTNVIFGILDGAKNEFNEFKIPGLPSFLLFRPGYLKIFINSFIVQINIKILPSLI